MTLEINKNDPVDDSMIVFNCHKKDSQRLVTVINHYPWYQSTGRNSGYAGTWFFFGGILEKKLNHHSSGWLIKPGVMAEGHYSKIGFFGSKTIHYVRRHSINKLINCSRFGDIEKACISASLGGGFWLSCEGKGFKRYLKKHYPNYFLSSDLIKNVYQSAMRTDLPVYSDPEKVNLWLQEQGVTTVGMLHNESLLIRASSTSPSNP